MNERIKQITGQVLDEIVPDTWTTLGYDKIKQIQYRTAELIVRECMDICYRTDTEYEGHKVKSTVIASKVAQHFGVEE
jgi:hypothetical protein